MGRRPGRRDDCRGIPEQIVDERDGLLVPPGDSAALARALLRILEDHDLASRLRTAAAERARSGFSYGEMLDRIMSVYACALAPDRPRPDLAAIETATV